MSSLRLAGVAFAYPQAPAPVFRHVDADLPEGWTAIAGPNGAGKTTLLRVLAGELAPDEGRVERAGLAFAYVRQAPDEPPEDVVQLAWTWDGPACRVRARLGLEVEQLERWPTLSGGERQRWQIAAALYRRVDVLLLDEPTNHLDAQARAHLAEALRAHRGVGVIVAHDRAFLDALVERVLWVEGGRVRCLPGTYSEVRARQRAEHDRAVHLRANAKAERARLARELDARRRREAASRRNIGVRSRAKGPADSDAREAGRKVRAAAAATQHARAAKRMRARVDGAADALERTRVDEERHGALTLRGGPARKPFRVELAADGRALSESVLVMLAPTARVRLAGPNGCGKTTLLEALVRAWPHARERLLYLPQREPDGVALLAAIESAPPAIRGEAWTLAAALGLDVATVRRSARPSPGEARKLALAEGLAREVWCVMLDEPTNHLDVPSIERLEAALDAYRGALLLVTHDAALADAVTEQTWTLEGGALRL